MENITKITMKLDITDIIRIILIDKKNPRKCISNKQLKICGKYPFLFFLTINDINKKYKNRLLLKMLTISLSSCDVSSISTAMYNLNFYQNPH